MENKENAPLWHHHGNASPKVIPVAAEQLARGEDVVYGDGRGKVYRKTPSGNVQVIRQEKQNAILA